MIPVSNPTLLPIALARLASHKQYVGMGFKGRLIQLFLGLKFYQNQIPSMHSGRYMTPEVLQMLLDDLYARASRPLNSCVLMFFESTYLARTGVVAPGNVSAQNTWRNNLNIQKGIGCYAPPNILAGPTFLNQLREDCQFLLPLQAGEFSGSRCSLCSSGAYRNEEHRKWLRIDTNRSGYAAIDSSDVTNFSPYVAPAGKRIPIVPLIVAVYQDANPGLVLARRQTVSLNDFQSDFNFSTAEIHAYFDTSSANVHNAAVISQGEFEYDGFANILSSLNPVMAPVVNSPPAPWNVTSAVLSGTVVPPPQQNSGWGAQQCVAEALSQAGWTVHDVSRQQLGCDLLAKKNARTVLVEVKSSLSTCAPMLTSREWQQAQRYGTDYVLAIVENFSDSADNTVFWIVDPASTCSASIATSINYSISRVSWITATRTLAAL